MPPYTREEHSRLTAILRKQLGPEYVSKRPSGGGTVSYIEGWKAFNLANHVFGFDGWSSEIKSTTVDYVDDHGGHGRFSVGLSVVIRVTLKDGTFHEDIGYGSVENARSKAMAFEKCKKQAITDGMKRCLRCFGNVLGNCLYDKEYLKFMAKTKVMPTVFKEEDILRHPDIDRDSSSFSALKTDSSRPKSPIPAIANPPAPQPIINSKMTNEEILLFDDSMDDGGDEFNDLDEYELDLLDKSAPAKESTLPETLPENVQDIPQSVTFVRAKIATEVQNNPQAISMEKAYKNFSPNGLKRSLEIDHSKLTPIKRSQIRK